jgi:hypothetical protein
MSPRDRRVIAGVLALAAIVAVWLLVIQPKRDKASRLGSQITTAQQQLRAANSQVAVAQSDKRAYAKDYAVVARLGEAVPSNDNTGSLIYQLQSAANRTGVDFQSLVFAAGSGGGATASSLPPGVTVGPAGFPVMPFTFTFNGNFFHLANFFGALQHFVVVTAHRIDVSGRLMTLNAISLGAGPGGFPNITATINATTYLSSSGTGATTATSSPGTTPTTSSTASTSGTSSPASTAPAAITSPTP